MRRIVVLLFIIIAFSAVAQGPSAGVLRHQSGGTIPVGPFTYIDFTSPVTADGDIDTIATRWLTDNACSDELKVRFFRADSRGILGTLTLVGSAGPFATTNGLNVITFAPIAVKKGDLLAITQLKPGCGGVTFVDSRREDVVYEVSGDFNGGSLNSAGLTARPSYALNAVASQGPRLIGTLPVVGSAAGNFNSFFRTGLTVTNPSAYPSTIKLVFHPAGASSSPSDPSTTFTLAGYATKSYTDVVQAMSQSGLGTLDIYANAYQPVVAARIFNDAGTAGTSGFTEDLVTAEDGFIESQFTVVPLPADLTNYRLNVGIRTFATTTVRSQYFDANGTFLGQGPSKTYPANYFEQVSLATFSGNFAVPAGGMMYVVIESGGPAVFYTATTDNRTNDGSLKMFTLK
ncbi:MAG TPA: hypothetical protein VF787_13915 [Thermoanaerobaculia bacterium]